jgi:4-diphosphocytidyl-2-C-methyl-D-erythritol kinase
LGGGSSNAAGVLQALISLFELQCSAQDTVECARSLGSDIPFFLDDHPNPRPAIVSGVGHSVQRVEARAAEVVLVLPPEGCETGAVYRAFDALGLGSSFNEAAQRVQAGALEGDFGDLHNDLHPAAVHVYPWLAEIQDRLERELGTTIYLSGSGSTLYLINPSVAPAEIQRIVPLCRVIGTRTL